jgi:hypothetical protein
MEELELELTNKRMDELITENLKLHERIDSLLRLIAQQQEVISKFK